MSELGQGPRTGRNLKRSRSELGQGVSDLGQARTRSGPDQSSDRALSQAKTRIGPGQTSARTCFAAGPVRVRPGTVITQSVQDPQRVGS